MKIAVFGVWHVHAADYTRKAMIHGEVIGFYERDDTLAKAFEAQLGVPRFGTAEELLASDAEGVIVCSATSDHTADIIAIANAGKHIFTEKVLALTDRECAMIEEAVERNGVSFTISLFQKYIGMHIAVKDTVESGELGKINYFRFRNYHSGSTCNWLPKHFYNRAECGGGAMIDLGAHGMYLAEWLLGEPLSACSTFTVACEREDVRLKNADAVEDNAVTVMRYASGAIAINETGFVSAKSESVLEVMGDRGYLRAEGGRVTKCTNATEGKTVAVDVPESLPFPIIQFVTGEALPGCSMKEARALTRMMEMAYANVNC